MAEVAASLRVSLLTSDGLDRAAAGNLAARLPGVVIHPLERLAEADVLVLVAPQLTSALLRQVRTLSADRPVPVAAVLERVGDIDLLVAVEIGLRGVIWRSQAVPQRFGAMLHTVAAGDSDLPPDLHSRLIREVVALQRDVLVPNGLTPSGLKEREVELLALIAEGLGTTEISQKLQRSEHAVKNSLSKIMVRHGLRNRSHAVAYAMRAGLL